MLVSSTLSSELKDNLCDCIPLKNGLNKLSNRKQTNKHTNDTIDDVIIIPKSQTQNDH